MKKAELKKLLKPMIKECIKEVIFEDGILSNIVSEVAQGLGQPTVTSFEDKIDREALLEERKENSRQQRERLLSSINADAYGGVNVFEGTEPLSSAGQTSNQPHSQGPLSNIDPSDPGVDISGIFKLSGDKWSRHMK